MQETSIHNVQQEIDDIEEKLRGECPDYIAVARSLNLLTTADRWQALEPLDQDEIIRVRNKAVGQFEDEYKTLYDDALKAFSDKTLAFSERVEAMRPAIDARFQSFDDYYNTKFYALIADRYSDMQDKVNLLENPNRWDENKRKLLLNHLENYRATIVEQPEDWLHTNHRLLRQMQAALPRLDDTVEREFKELLAAQIDARTAVTSILADRTLYNLAAEIPRLIRAQQAGVLNVIDPSGEQMLVDDALSTAYRFYTEECLRKAQEWLLSATGYPELRQVIQFSKGTSAFRPDQTQPLHEIHRLLGRAWVLFDPEVRQVDRRVAGYITVGALGFSSGSHSRYQFNTDDEFVEVSDPEQDAVTSLLNPDPVTLNQFQADQWEQIQEIVDDLFPRVDEMVTTLERIRREQIDVHEAANLLVDKILPVYKHGDLIQSAWEKVQRDTFDYFQSWLSRWEAGYIRNTVRESDLKVVLKQYQNHPLRKRDDTLAKVIRAEELWSEADRESGEPTDDEFVLFRDAFELLGNRLARIKDAWDNIEILTSEFQQNWAQFNATCDEKNWREADVIANRLARQLGDANFLRPIDRELYQEELRVYQANRARVAGEEEVDAKWDEAYKVFENHQLWQEVITYLTAKEYDKLSPVQKRGAQARLAQAQYNNLVAHRRREGDRLLNASEVEDLVGIARDLLEEVPAESFTEFEQFEVTRQQIDQLVAKINRERATREVLTPILEEALLEEAGLAAYSTVYDTLCTVEIDPNDEGIRREYIREFVNDTWKPALHQHMLRVNEMGPQEISGLREQINRLKADDYWDTDDRRQMQQVAKALRQRYFDLHTSTPLRDSLFGLALQFDDYRQWINYGSFSLAEPGLYDEVMGCAVLAYYDTTDQRVGQAATWEDRQARYLEVKSFVLAHNAQEESQEDSVSTPEQQLGGTSAGIERWRQYAWEKARHVLYTGLLYAATQLIKSEHLNGPNASWAAIKSLHDDIDLYIKRLRYFTTVPHIFVVSDLWKYWLALSTIYHDKDYSHEYQSLSRMYGNYLLGESRLGQVDAGDALPYWVTNCQAEWNSFKNEVRIILVETATPELKNNACTPANLGQFLEYILMIQKLSQSPDSKEFVKQWIDKNPLVRAIGKVPESYRQELVDVIYDVGAGNVPGNVPGNGAPMPDAVPLEPRKLGGGLDSGLPVALDTVQQLRLRLKAITDTADQLSKNVNISLLQSRQKDSFEELTGDVTVVYQHLLDAVNQLDNLRRRFRDLLDPTKADMDNWQRYLSAIYKVIQQINGLIPNIVEVVKMPYPRREIPELVEMQALYEVVQREFETFKRLDDFKLFPDRDVDDLHDYFSNQLKTIKEAIDARDKISEHLAEHFDDIFPGEPEFSYDLPRYYLVEPLRKYQDLLPDDYQERIQIDGLDEYRDLLEKLTRRLGEWRRRINSFVEMSTALYEKAADVSWWARHFVGCDAIMFSYYGDAEQDIVELVEDMRVVVGNIPQTFATYALDGFEGAPIAFGRITLELLGDYAVVWSDWLASLHDLAYDEVTTDVVRSLQPIQRPLEMLRDALQEMFTEMRSNISRYNVYHKVVFGCSESEFREYVRSMDDLLGRIKQGNISLALLNKIVEAAEASMSLLYGKQEQYVRQSVQRYAGYVKELEEEINYKKNPPQSQQGGLLQRFLGRREPAPPAIDNDADIRTYQNAIRYLKRQHPRG